MRFRRPVAAERTRMSDGKRGTGTRRRKVQTDARAEEPLREPPTA